MQDVDEGFVDDGTAKKQKSEANAPPLGLPAHFALKGTAEHTIVSSQCLRMIDNSTRVFDTNCMPVGRTLDF